MAIVTNGARGKTVVVDRTRNVATVQQSGSTIRVQDRNIATRITEQRRVLAVAAMGPQGPKGDAGLSGGGTLPVLNFAYGDASPRTLLTMGADSEVVSVSLEIEVAFDGDAPQIQLGTTTDPAALMATDQSAPSQVGIYEVAPRVALLAGDAIVLSLNPGVGASQGRGQFVINAVPSA